MYESDTRRSRRGLSFGPFLIIILGAIFLLNNFGFLPWEIWQNLWKFWPVLLILFGSEVLLGRTSSVKTIGFLLVLIFLLPVLLILNPLTGNPLAKETLKFEKPLGSLAKSEISLNLPSSNITISKLNIESQRVLESSVSYSKLLPKPDLSEEKRFGEARYSLTQPGTNLPFSNNLGNTVDLKLSQLITYSLFISATTGVFDFDFENLNINLLEINSGATSMSIKYQKKGVNKTFIRSTAANLNLELPSEMDAKIKIDSKINNLKFDKTRFEQADKIIRTKNFDTSLNKVEVEIVGSVASLTLR